MDRLGHFSNCTRVTRLAAWAVSEAAAQQKMTNSLCIAMTFFARCNGKRTIDASKWFSPKEEFSGFHLKPAADLRNFNRPRECSQLVLVGLNHRDPANGTSGFTSNIMFASVHLVQKIL